MCSDAEILKTKGPTIFNGRERAEIIRHCKFVEAVEEDTVYTPTIEFIDKIGCSAYAHGDDPCIDADGNDVCEPFRKAGRFKLIKRTEGVSTTTLTGRLLALADETTEDKPEQKMEPPVQKFLQTSWRINKLSNGKAPTADDTIVYIQGSWDILHHGHLKRLELAK